MSQAQPAQARPPTQTSSGATASHDQVQVDVAKLPIDSDPSLRLVWVDKMDILVRGDIPMATLRFYSVIGDKLAEASRLQTSVSHLKAIADVICRVLNHYPEKQGK